MQAAVRDVVEYKVSQNQAAQRHGVPQPTLSRRLNGKIAKQDVEFDHQVLTGAQRQHLKHWILTQERLGYAPSHDQIRACVLAILRKERPDKEAKLGRNWVSRFIEHEDDLKTKYGRRHEAIRWEAFTPKAVGWFFDILEQYS
jgi:transcriptional regulator with XRE-family HTH domain